nr:hypothetical protein Iba_chr14fCG1730 [Ipomoea batatas]
MGRVSPTMVYQEETEKKKQGEAEVAGFSSMLWFPCAFSSPSKPEFQLCPLSIALPASAMKVTVKVVVRQFLFGSSTQNTTPCGGGAPLQRRGRQKAVTKVTKTPPTALKHGFQEREFSEAQFA